MRYIKPLTRTIALLLCLLLIQQTAAQKFNLDDPIPIDQNVRIGKLENGFTYYIRKNSKPENRAEFRLFLNAGSVQEDDDQLGLAHLVEHMAFNGTKNFEKNELIHYMQSIGMKMGPDINGFTSFEQVGYILTVPTDSMEAFDNGLLIMEDWAHNISFDPEEVDKERGIVVEEWRLGRGAYQRMLDQYLPVLFKDSRHAERLPIGKKEVIENASYEAIKRYYEDWYRPELLAFVAVGDFDLESTEKKIHERFGKISKKESPRKKETYEIPDHKEMLVSVVSDKENPYTQVQMLVKHDLKEKTRLQDLRKSLVIELFTGMLNQRYNELREKPDAPFLYGGTYYGQFVSNKKAAYQNNMMVKEDGIETGIQTMLRENERIKKFGFTQGELDRYKSSLLKKYETSYNEREKTESASFTWQYMNHFLNGSPIPGAEFMHEFAQEVVPSIDIEEVNNAARELITDENKVVIVLGIEKEGVVLPSGEEVIEMVKNTNLDDLTPYQDEPVVENLIPQLPEPGKIVEEKWLEELEVTEFRLSNGATVQIKSTDFKNDQIVFESLSPGGQSLYGDEDMYNARFAASLVSESGTGPYSKTEMRKFLAGKRAWSNPYINQYFEGIRGGGSPDDLETIFQMLYLNFTQPIIREDATMAYINRQKEVARNQLSDPVRDFFYQASLIKADFNLRSNPMAQPEEYDKIEPDRALEIYKERFSDASDFTFFFVGAFDKEEIKPLIEQYIGNLPSSNSKEQYKDLNIRAPKDLPREEFVYRGSDPKSFVSLYFEKPVNYADDDWYLMRILSSYLRLRYFDVLREEMSGVYGFGANASLHHYPWEHAELSIIIPCGPENVDKLVKAAIAELKDIRENGISDDYIEKLKNTDRKDYEKSIKENNPWLYALYNPKEGRGNYDFVLERERLISLITSDELKRIVNSHIDLDNYVKVVLLPEEYKMKTVVGKQ